MAAPEHDGGWHGLFAETARRRPDAVAVADARARMTFAELHDRAQHVARRLGAAGVGRGQTVGVRVGRTNDLAVATLGAAMAGAAFVPLNPDDPEARRSFILADSGASAILTDTPDGTDGDLTVIDVTAPPPRDPDPVPPIAVCGTDTAYVIYTSGTTGRPKGVVMEHRGIANTLLACRRLLGFGDDDVSLVMAASTFDVFYFELFGVMLAGGSARIVTRSELFSPPALVEILGRATTVQAVPGLMEHLLTALSEEGVTAISRLRTVLTGGDTVPAPLLGRLVQTFPEARVAVAYGPTEAAVFATMYPVDPRVAVHDHPVGTPLPGVEVLVTDARGNELPAGVVGEIRIGGAGVARGYLNRPDENAARFVTRHGRRYYRTGDLGVVRRDDGVLEFRGRDDTQVKVRGFRVELGEVEAALTGLRGVRQAAVAAVGDDGGSQRLVACAVVSPQSLEEARGAPNRSGAVEEWRALFDRTHAAGSGGGRDFTGWNSSYDGRPMPTRAMDEWVDGTVSALREATAGGPPRRVLEIGCGTGLILLELAPGSERYVGTDFSHSAIADLRERVAERDLDHVELHVAEAGRPPAGHDGVDLVIVNSVSQYLTDSDHLTTVLDAALHRLRPGGVLFVGDVRSLPLLEAFHLSVADARHPDSDDGDRLATARLAAQEEGELVLHPWFFHDYAARRGLVSVGVEPRRGHHSNEMNKYRYDVVLRTPGPVNPGGDPPPAPEPWADRGWSRNRLARVLEDGPVDALHLEGIPHGLVHHDVTRHRALTGGAPVEGEPLAPQDLRDLAVAHGHRAVLDWSGGGATFDALIIRDGTALPARPPRAHPWDGPTANQPWSRTARRVLAERLVQGLARLLPAYMLPSSLRIVDALPLTPNGKVDRSRLPAAPPPDTKGRAPSTPTERVVAQAWEEVLGTGSVTATDDFFTVGGTSLLAIRMTVNLRRRGLRLAPQTVFEQRTVERIAQRLDQLVTGDSTPGARRTRPWRRDPAGAARVPWPRTRATWKSSSSRTRARGPPPTASS
ncbi:amino acid adenylation domain-containing protein [Nocardiopsis sp. CNR-923]|uniref:non-ribosomal peptide synthetase n=1 Tax=Nocardiopsis sp. CNR-923 TaxID=1904965 RepID=UPI0021CCCD38|nr:amino acid adenylation domain-containing protein [Nocardiopsis sp. CNR-923]